MSAEAGSTCFHCGLPNPPQSNYTIEYEDQARHCCCMGCASVAKIIIDSGEGRYYAYRTELPEQSTVDSIPEFLSQVDIYDNEVVQRGFLETETSEGLKETALIIEGIHCAACVWLNEHHVHALAGVVQFSINLSTHRARLIWDDSQIQLSEILRAIAAIGYKAHPFDTGRQQSIFKQERTSMIRRMAVAGLGAMQAMMIAVALYIGAVEGMEESTRDFLRLTSMLLATMVVAYPAMWFFKSAFSDLKRRRLGMDVPVSIAIIAAFTASVVGTFIGSEEVYFDSVTMFTFFLLIGRYLEMNARHKAGTVAEGMMNLLPISAIRVNADGEQEAVAATELQVNDIVLVKSSETLPADGEVIEGQSEVDESLLTGESLPVMKRVGHQVVAGSVNRSSNLSIRVTSTGDQMVLSHIVKLIDSAASSKPKIGQLADKVSQYFVMAQLFLSAIVFATWSVYVPSEAFWITIAVLVVSCPCALALATPVALTAAIGRLTKQGVLVADGQALETLSQAKHLLFDKTGTLTEGHIRIVETHVSGISRDDAIQIAKSLEQYANHPIAQAFMREASVLVNVDEVETIVASGVEGKINAQSYRIGSEAFVGNVPVELSMCDVFLSRAERVVAGFVLADSLKPEAVEVVSTLQTQGYTVHLISGDKIETVKSVAKQLGIVHATGQMLPQDKLDYLQRIQAKEEQVIMVGDGVNDAPVLSGANTSIAMGTGTQVAQLSSDMVLMSGDLHKLTQAVEGSRATMQIIRQNYAWAIGYNLLGVPLAAFGFIPPWAAAVGMSLSSLIVVVNALRLR